MAIVEDGVVLAIGFADLVKALGDQVCADAVARHEGERGLEKIEPPQRRKLVQHRSEEHTSELQSLMRTSYAVFCLQKKKKTSTTTLTSTPQSRQITSITH